VDLEGVPAATGLPPPAARRNTSPPIAAHSSRVGLITFLEGRALNMNRLAQRYRNQRKEQVTALISKTRRDVVEYQDLVNIAPQGLFIDGLVCATVRSPATHSSTGSAWNHTVGVS
jgi:hypothetical protein